MLQMHMEGSTLRGFFADLANMRPVNELPTHQVNQVLDKFRDELLAMTGGAPTVLVPEIPRDGLLALLCLRQQQFKELLSEILGAVWLSARQSSPIGIDIEHPVPLTMLLRRFGGKVSWNLVSAERSDPTAAALLTVTMGPGFPFGVCRQRKCRKIFARNGRGRPQKYCSAACKGRGVPSAKKRSKYVAAYRARRRAEDVRRISALLEHCKREDRYALLRRTFPGRPAKSILYVMRQAEKLLDATRRQRHAKSRKRQPMSK